MPLVLTRRKGQSLTIGHDISILIRGNFTGNVQLVITAPPEIKILRDDAICREAKPDNPTTISLRPK